MNTNLKSVSYPEAPIGTRIAAACAAFVISASLLGGLFGLFEMHSEDAMIGRAAQVPAAATVVVDASNKAQVAGVKNTTRS
jgi:hypothetical protein